MSPAQQHGLALWGALLSALVCLLFLPVSRLVSIAVLLVMSGLIMAFWYVMRHRTAQEMTFRLEGLPDTAYRQPVVLVCGDLTQTWPKTSQVLTVTRGCWIRVEDHQDLTQVARQLLWLRPEWGNQLSVIVTVCPQKWTDRDALSSRLLTLRWQISQLRRDTGLTVPVILSAQAGSAMTHGMFWQTEGKGAGSRVWQESSAPGPIPEQVAPRDTMTMQQHVLMNTLMDWFHRHVRAVFMNENPDIPVITPAIMLWGIRPFLAESLTASVWTEWLAQRTALQHVAGWQSGETDSTGMPLLPDVVLSLLPKSQSLTPRSRAWCYALGMFTLATLAALLSSGWNNRQLLHRLSFDIAHYGRVAKDNDIQRATAITTLRQDSAQLDSWARNGEPVRMGLGLYQGERLRIRVLDVLRSHTPTPSLPTPALTPIAGPQIIQLDSMSLFDSGTSALKPDATKTLVNSLVDIKAKPGWLIVVTGHTDNTGNPQLNQTLSQKRAEAVRRWMRDTGDMPESCFAVQGYGESRPVATNDTPEGRSLNRRVEISLVPQPRACQLPDNSHTSSQDDDVSQHNGE